MTAPWDRPGWPNPHPMQQKFDAYHADRRRQRHRLASLFRRDGRRNAARFTEGHALTAGSTVPAMTTPPTSPGPQPPSGQPTPLGPPTAPAKKSKLPWILGGVALVVLLCFGGCTAVLVSTADEVANEGKKAVSTATPAAAGTTAAAPATTAAAPSYPVPKPAEFKLTVKLLDKQCFGSAGCNVEFRISDVTYTGSGMDPSATYEISYQFKGLEDPQIGTFELSGDGSYSIEERQFGSTKKSADKVTAVVTAVEKM